MAFESTASNLVANDRNGLSPDVFLRDLVAKVTTLQSVDSAGRQSGGDSTNAHLSADGSTVAFTSTSAPRSARHQHPRRRLRPHPLITM